jgi:hypothetical protein
MYNDDSDFALTIGQMFIIVNVQTESQLLAYEARVINEHVVKIWMQARCVL